MKRSSLGPDATAPCGGAGWEPSLDEILREPIVRQLMARDGVTEPAMRRLAEEIAARLGRPDIAPQP